MELRFLPAAAGDRGGGRRTELERKEINTISGGTEKLRSDSCGGISIKRLVRGRSNRNEGWDYWGAFLFTELVACARFVAHVVILFCFLQSSS